MRERVTRLSSYIVLRSQGKILLCRLSAGTSAPGFWTLPGGGLEFGESPEDAVVREVLEETGLSVSGLRLQAIWSDTEIFEGKDYHLLRFIYTGTFTPEKLRLETEGSTDLCEWIDESELDHLPLVRLVKKVRALLQNQSSAS